MAKIFIIFLIICGLLAAPCFADFRFAVISDTQASDQPGMNNSVLEAIMNMIKSEKVDFILVTGDMVSGSTLSSEHIKQLREWKVFMDSYNIPVYCAVGNHIIQSEASEGIYRSIFEMPENGPEGFKELAYSFDYDNAHFTVIDTDKYRSFHNIGDVQFSWLNQDLEQNKNKIIFVFGHDPAFPVSRHKFNSLDKFPSKRDELWALFKSCNVRAYFCGHEHLYNKSEKDGVYQIIAGGGGGALYATPENGGFRHFVVVDVKNSGECEIVVKDIKGFIRDSFKIEPSH